MLKRIMFFVLCFSIFFTALYVWAAEEEIDKKTDINESLIRSESTIGFFGKSFLYYDSVGNKLKGSTLIDFLNEHSYAEGASKVKTGLGMTTAGRIMWGVGAGAMCIGALYLNVADFNSETLLFSMSMAGGGFVCSITGMIILYAGRNKINKVVKAYNYKVENGELSFTPLFDSDRFSLLLVCRF